MLFIVCAALRLDCARRCVTAATSDVNGGGVDPTKDYRRVHFLALFGLNIMLMIGPLATVVKVARDFDGVTASVEFQIASAIASCSVFNIGYWILFAQKSATRSSALCFATSTTEIWAGELFFSNIVAYRCLSVALSLSRCLVLSFSHSSFVLFTTVLHAHRTTPDHDNIHLLGVAQHVLHATVLAMIVDPDPTTTMTTTTTKTTVIWKTLQRKPAVAYLAACLATLGATFALGAWAVAAAARDSGGGVGPTEGKRAKAQRRKKSS